MTLGRAESESLRRRVAGWRAAETRELLHRQEEQTVTPEQAWAFAEEIRELNPEAFRGPDPVREREVLRARACWMRLRERFSWPPDAPR